MAGVAARRADNPRVRELGSSSHDPRAEQDVQLSAGPRLRSLPAPHESAAGLARAVYRLSRTKPPRLANTESAGFVGSRIRSAHGIERDPSVAASLVAADEDLVIRVRADQPPELMRTTERRAAEMAMNVHSPARGAV